MDSRNTNTSSNNTLARQQIEQFRCFITTSIMFEPVMISGCGHLIEGKEASKLRECPACRYKKSNGGIDITAAPAVITSLLASILSADPSLWKDVHLDTDYLKEVLQNNKMGTPTGERFIKLLENNSPENLNNNQYEPSVIEILAGYPTGRELLRKNTKIQALISDAVKQKMVNGKTINEWIKMGKEEATPKAEESVFKKPRTSESTGVANSQGFFTNTTTTTTTTTSTTSTRANNTTQALAPNRFWQCLAEGNLADAEPILRANPSLAEQEATVTIYSGQVIENAAPFEIALRTGDHEMAQTINDIYLFHDFDVNPVRQAVINAQFNQVFPRGFDAHIEEQKRSALQFERDYLTPLISVMENASFDDLKTALTKSDNGSALCKALTAFRTAFNELSMSEKVYNPYHLLKAFEINNAHCREWPDSYRDSTVSRQNVFWRLVVGHEERYMSAGYVRSIGLIKNLKARYYNSNWIDVDLFQRDTNPSFRLGFDFAVDFGLGNKNVCVDGGNYSEGKDHLEDHIDENESTISRLQPSAHLSSAPPRLGRS